MDPLDTWHPNIKIMNLLDLGIGSKYQDFHQHKYYQRKESLISTRQLTKTSCGLFIQTLINWAKYCCANILLCETSVFALNMVDHQEIQTSRRERNCYHNNILPNRWHYLPESLGKDTTSCLCSLIFLQINIRCGFVCASIASFSQFNCHKI